MYGNYSIIQATWLNSSVMPPEDVDKMANSVDPDKTAPGLKEQSFMGLHCLSSFVQNFRKYLSTIFSNMIKWPVIAMKSMISIGIKKLCYALEEHLVYKANVHIAKTG